MSGSLERPFLYVVVCAAGVAPEVGTLISAAQDRGWGVGVVATPATFNTVNKWAAEVSDTLALGILYGAYGLGIPTGVLPT